MKFFNVNSAKQVIENIANNALPCLAISSPFVLGYSMYKDSQKRSEIFKKYEISRENPNNRYRYDDEEITCRGVKGYINGRIVDKETGAIVARCP